MTSKAVIEIHEVDKGLFVAFKSHPSLADLDLENGDIPAAILAAGYLMRCLGGFNESQQSDQTH